MLLYFPNDTGAKHWLARAWLPLGYRTQRKMKTLNRKKLRAAGHRTTGTRTAVLPDRDPPRKEDKLTRPRTLSVHCGCQARKRSQQRIPPGNSVLLGKHNPRRPRPMQEQPISLYPSRHSQLDKAYTPIGRDPPHTSRAGTVSVPRSTMSVCRGEEEKV